MVVLGIGYNREVHRSLTTGPPFYHLGIETSRHLVERLPFLRARHVQPLRLLQVAGGCLQSGGR